MMMHWFTGIGGSVRSRRFPSDFRDCVRFAAGRLPHCILLLAAGSATAALGQSPRQQPLPIDEAMEMFEVHPDLRIELVASEPQVIDPITATFDDRGRLWVVEMNDYPTLPADQAPNGKIKILTDTDGDGFFETVVVFADSLVFPTGLTPFGQGAIVTLAGEVVYMADTDGDSKADHRETWFTGFSEDNEQLRANHPTWTLENQIHVASGLRGGQIRSADPRWPESAEPLSLSARDFQFSPFGGNYRAVAGNSQFGFYQDAGGRNFVCSNRNPCRLLLADADQIAGNPLQPIAQWIVDVMPAAEASQVFALTEAWTTSNLHAGQFTAACGVFRYQSDWLSPVLKDDFFACEPTGSLVQRYRQTADGIVPTVARGREGVEFLASRDSWFRPVDLFDGPDGAMYVVDMHRAVIEHPAWMPKELQAREDLRWGDTAGRIYRLVPREADQRPEPSIDFATAPVQQWVTALASENRWARVTAARRLAETLNGLKGQGEDAASKTPRETTLAAIHAAVAGDVVGHAVSQALWLLAANEALPLETVAKIVAHRDPDVRRQAIRLLAQHRSQWPQADELLTALASDADPHVRYQWLLELAPQADTALVAALATAAQPGSADSADDRQWIARAVSLTSDAAAVALVEHLLGQIDAQAAEPKLAADKHATRPQVIQPLVRRLGWAGSAQTLALLLGGSEAVEITPARDALLNEFAAGLVQRGRPWTTLTKDLPPPLQARLQERLLADRQIVADPEQPLARRVASLQRIGLDRSAETLALGLQIIEEESEDLYVEALSVVRHFDDPALAPALVERVVELPPRAATSTVAAMVSNPNWTAHLVDALAAGDVPWGLIDPTSLRQLERHRDSEIAQRVKTLRAGRTTEDRGDLLNRYREALSGTPDVVAGQKHFVQHCAACHRIGDQGFAVGPDISDLRTQTPEQLLIAILDPNAAIDANYYRYLVLTDDGQVIEGLLEDSNQQSITLRLQDDVRRTVPRAQIDQLRATGVSMMPEGFENQISPEAMRDLIGYLKRWRLLSSEIPLSQ